MPLGVSDDKRVLDYYHLKDSPGVCREENTVFLTWDRNDACWDGNPFCWDDVAFILESFGDVIPYDASKDGWLGAYEKLDEPKKKRFIYLVAKVKGDDDIYKGKKEVKDIKVSVKDIKLTVSEVLGIKIDVEKK